MPHLYYGLRVQGHSTDEHDGLVRRYGVAEGTPFTVFGILVPSDHGRHTLVHVKNAERRFLSTVQQTALCDGQKTYEIGAFIV